MKTVLFKFLFLVGVVGFYFVTFSVVFARELTLQSGQIFAEPQMKVEQSASNGLIGQVTISYSREITPQGIVTDNKIVGLNNSALLNAIRVQKNTILTMTLAPNTTGQRQFNHCNGASSSVNLDWEVVEIPEVDWLDVTPKSGSIPALECDLITAMFDTNGLDIGVYNTILRFVSNAANSPQDLMVELTVSDQIRIETCILGKYFIQGVNVENRYDAFVPDMSRQVIFRLNGDDTIVDVSNNPVSTFYDMGEDLIYSIPGVTNLLSARAVDQNGNESEPAEIDLVGIGWPQWLFFAPDHEQTGDCRTGTSELTYIWKRQYPEEPFQGQITPPDWVPFLGGSPLGIKDTQATLDIEAKPVGTGSVKVTGESGFEVADQEINGEATGQGDVSISEDAGIQLDAATLALEINGKVEGERPVVDIICKSFTAGTCPLKEAEDWLIIGDLIKLFNEVAIAKATIEPTLAGAADFESNAAELVWKNSTIDTNLKLTLALILTVIEDISAEIYGGGEPKATYQFPPDPSYLKRIAIEIFAGLRLKVFGIEHHFPATYEWSYSPGGLMVTSAIGKQTLVFETEWRPIPRNYATDATKYSIFQANNSLFKVAEKRTDTSSTTEHILVSNVFPEGHPTLASANNSLLLLWVHDEANKPVMQGSEIQYSVYDGSNWSTPAGITNDYLQDFGPEITFGMNGQAIAVWERNKDIQSASTQLDANYTKSFELAYAVWNNNRWSDPILLTDNDVFDHAPKLVKGNDGQILLVWRQNAGGEFLGSVSDPDSLLYTVWDGATWSTPRILLSNIVGLISFTIARHDDDAMVVIYSQDTDGNFATSQDQELYQVTWNGSAWSNPSRLTNDNEADNKPTFFYDTNGNPHLLWLKGDRIYAIIDDLEDSPQEALIENSAAILDYLVAQDNDGNFTLLWQGYSDEGVDLFYKKKKKKYGVFSLIRQLTHEEALEKFAAPVFGSAGELLMAYNETTLITKTITVSPTSVIENVTDFGQTNLNFLTHSFGPDLALTPIDLIFNSEALMPGDVIRLDSILHNVGDQTVVNPAVNFYLGDPAVGGDLIENITIPLTMAGGMTATVSVDWETPESGGGFTIYAVGDPDNVVAEANEANNTTNIMIEIPRNENFLYLPMLLK